MRTAGYMTVCSRKRQFEVCQLFVKYSLWRHHVKMSVVTGQRRTILDEVQRRLNLGKGLRLCVRLCVRAWVHQGGGFKRFHVLSKLLGPTAVSTETQPTKTAFRMRPTARGTAPVRDRRPKLTQRRFHRSALPRLPLKGGAESDGTQIFLVTPVPRSEVISDKCSAQISLLACATPGLLSQNQ